MLVLLIRWFSIVSQYCKTLYKSFYSSVLYEDAVKHWQGLGLGYLLFLILLGSIPLSARIIIEFNHFFNERILFPIQALPLLAVNNGEITYNQPMPYLIKNNKLEVVSIIDTTGSVNEINQTYPQLSVLVTKNKMDIRPPSFKQFLGLVKNNIGNSVYTRTFDKGLNGLFSGKEWIKSTEISKLNILMQLIIFPSITIFYFGIFGVTLFLLSALVQLYSDIFFRFKLSFKASCRLSAIAVTPTLVLFFFIRYGNFGVPGIGLVYIVIFLSYISFGLFSANRLTI